MSTTTDSVSLLAGWATFYEIVGSAAGALTGLQFVVMTLIKQTQTVGSRREIRAFGTPTVVHFCVALLVSGIMSAPWVRLADVGYVLLACGIVGVAYSASVVWHAAKANYRPDLGDWFWFVSLPFVAYGGLIAAAMTVNSRPILSLFAIAATAVLFLFIGIHNSWDTVTYIALQPHRASEVGEGRAIGTSSRDDIN